jgi:mono/diheme cytochrome c family protein
MRRLVKGIAGFFVGMAISTANAIPQTGEVFYNELGCVACHGSDATGNADMGPSLVGKDISRLVEHMISARLGFIENSPMDRMFELEGKEESIAVWLTLIVNQDID